MNAEKGGGEVKRGRVQMREYRVQSTDNRGGRGGADLVFHVSSFWFHVLGVRLLPPPETGGGGMTQGQVKVLAVGTRHAVSETPMVSSFALADTACRVPTVIPIATLGRARRAEGV